MSKTRDPRPSRTPKIITIKDMTYIEALACHTAAGKRRCDWCKKPAKYFVRQNVSYPGDRVGRGFHMSLAPKCVTCVGLEAPES